MHLSERGSDYLLIAYNTSQRCLHIKERTYLPRSRSNPFLSLSGRLVDTAVCWFQPPTLR